MPAHAKTVPRPRDPRRERCDAVHQSNRREGNLAATFEMLGRCNEAQRIWRDNYSGTLRLYGEEHEETIQAANNYALSLKGLSRFEEAKSLLRRTVPVARRALGENHNSTLKMRWIYALALYEHDANGIQHTRLYEQVEVVEEQREGRPTAWREAEEERAARREAERRSRERELEQRVVHGVHAACTLIAQRQEA